MAGPIYKLWMFRPTEAWYQLPKEEREGLANKAMEDIEKAGGKSMLICDPTWSTERWWLFGIDEYPDIEAEQRLTELLVERDHFRYIEVESMLGTKWQPSKAA
jgi:hypothetical protein